MKINTEVVLEASVEVVLEINTEKNKSPVKRIQGKPVM
jgi:hypothetical protein